MPPGNRPVARTKKGSVSSSHGALSKVAGRQTCSSSLTTSPSSSRQFAGGQVPAQPPPQPCPIGPPCGELKGGVCEGPFSGVTLFQNLSPALSGWVTLFQNLSPALSARPDQQPTSSGAGACTCLLHECIKQTRSSHCWEIELDIKLRESLATSEPARRAPSHHCEFSSCWSTREAVGGVKLLSRYCQKLDQRHCSGKQEFRQKPELLSTATSSPSWHIHHGQGALRSRALSARGPAHVL